MFSRRKTRLVSDAPYTGVSGIPGNRASSNAHAAASAIASALKDSNGSATDMKLPPTQVRSSSLLRNSNSFRGSLRTNSINGIHSRTNSLVYPESPLQRQRQQHIQRHSLTPQSLKQLNAENEFGSLYSDGLSDYADDYTAEDFKQPPRQHVTKKNSNLSNGVRHKVSFSDASSEVSSFRSPQKHFRQLSQPLTPTRKKTIKKYVPSANGLVAIEVPVEEEEARINAIKNSSRNSSITGTPRRPISRSASLTGVSHQTRQKVRYSAIPEEPKNTDLNSIEQVKERLQREREQLEQQYLAKLEEERLYQEKIEKERTLLEQAEKERLQKEFEDEVERQRQIELEKKQVLAEKAAAEAEEAALIQKQNQERAELELKEKEEEESAAAAASALEEKLLGSAVGGKTIVSGSEKIESFAEERNELGAGTIDSFGGEPKVDEVHPVDSVVSAVTGNHEASDDLDLSGTTDPDSFLNGAQQPAIGASNTELDVVNGYRTYSTDSLLLHDKNDTSSRSVPTSAELSENLGTTTDITENDSYEETSTNNHLSMAKQLRSAMLLPTVLINDAPRSPSSSQQDEIPRRSERRLSNSSALGNTLSRKKSALKHSSKYETSPTRPSETNAAAQAYLSLTTAENTRLNALNTQSSLSLAAPENPIKKSVSPQQPKLISRKTVKPLTPKTQNKRLTEDFSTRKKPITIHLPQQVSPGKFVLPKSDAKKKADELYKKANSKPRQNEEQLKKNLPPLLRKSSFEKAREASQLLLQQRFSMRDPQQIEPAYQQVNQNAPPKPQPYRPNDNTNGFKSRFADSDSDDDFPSGANLVGYNKGSNTAASSGQNQSQFRAAAPRKSSQKGGHRANGEVEDEKKKKKFGKLKKLFGRN